MPISSEELDTLIERIRERECTPFLGAGACSGMLPLASEIAIDWAKKYNYPMKDSTKLDRVAEFLAVTKDPMIPKDLIKKKFNNFKPLDSTEAEKSIKALRSMAHLRLPLYITTNYDNFIEDALQSEYENVEIKTEYLRWNRFLKEESKPSIFDSGFLPTKDDPVVFHFHGHIKVKESLVLTEGDYQAFLKNITKDPDMIPAAIKRALTTTTVLFLGYRLADLNFQVVFHGILSVLERSIRRKHISVQLVSEKEIAKPDKDGKDRARKYLDSYFERYNIKISWGKCCDFIKKLMEQGGFD